MKIEDAVGTTQKEIELSGEVFAVNFGHEYLYYEVRNDGNEDIYVSTTDNECTAGEKGVVCVPAGTGYTHCNGYGGSEKIYLLGKGKATVIAKNYSESSFMSVKKGGGYAVAGASSYALNNAVDYPLLGLNLYGKSTQDGEPTPDTPIDIVSVGDSGSVSVQVCGKNLLNPTLKTTTINGIICTNNGDGTYTLNGTAEKETYFKFGGIDSIIDKTYMLVCSPVGYNKTTYIAFFTNSVNGYENQPYVSKSTRLSVELVIKSGIALNNTIFKPMITTDLSATYDDFEPHISTTATITSALPLCGIPVDSDGNYTDSIGQQWVCDELVYNANGTGKIIKCTDKINSYNGEKITTPHISTTGELTTGATVIYALAEPQEIELTAADVSALMQLHTYNGMTNISNSGNADMDVKYCTNKMLSEYVMPVITNMQAQIDELKSAVLSLGGNI